MLKLITPALFYLMLIHPAAAQSVGGAYSLAGTNPDGSAYTGTVDVTIDGTDCQMTWTLDGGQVQGICLESEGALATSYVVGGVLTLVLYRAQPDGVLNGTWRVDGEALTGGEVLTPR
jgi:hypothetical protein